VVVNGKLIVHRNGAAADVNPGRGLFLLAAHCVRTTEALRDGFLLAVHCGI
jgi:hypothetical protein